MPGPGHGVVATSAAVPALAGLITTGKTGTRQVTTAMFAWLAGAQRGLGDRAEGNAKPLKSLGMGAGE